VWLNITARKWQTCHNSDVQNHILFYTVIKEFQLPFLDVIFEIYLGFKLLVHSVHVVTISYTEITQTCYRIQMTCLLSCSES